MTKLIFILMAVCFSIANFIIASDNGSYEYEGEESKSISKLDLSTYSVVSLAFFILAILMYKFL